MLKAHKHSMSIPRTSRTRRRVAHRDAHWLRHLSAPVATIAGLCKAVFTDATSAAAIAAATLVPVPLLRHLSGRHPVALAAPSPQSQLLLCSLWYGALDCAWRRPALAQGFVGVTSECSRLCVLYGCQTGRKCVVTDCSPLCTAAPDVDWGPGFIRRPKRSRNMTQL